MLIGLVDAMMVGRVGVVPLAAASLVNQLTHLPLVFGLGLLTSIAVVTSQAFGASKKEEMGEVLRHGLVVSFGAGLATALLVTAMLPMLGWLGQPAEVVAASGTYLLLFGWSMMFALLSHGGKQFSEALNHPWVPNCILLGGVLLNILLNWVLIYGNWGAPAMGLEGAGWATLLARAMTAFVMVIYLMKAPALRRFQPLRWKGHLDRALLMRLLRLGLPVGMQHLLEVSAFVFAAIMMGWISAEAIASHQIALNCAATSFMFSLGVGMAVCIRVGHAGGAGHYRRVRRIGYLGLGMASVIMALFALAFITMGKPVAAWFVKSPDVIDLAAKLLLIAAWFQIADGLQVVAVSALRGLSDVRVPALIAVLAYWVVAVPLGAALAFARGLGAVGIWIGLATGLVAAAVILTWRFHGKSSREVRLE